MWRKAKVMDQTAAGQGPDEEESTMRKVSIKKKSRVPGVMITQFVEEIPEGKSTPDFTRKPIAMTIQEGKLAFFKAVITGHPTPDVTWKRAKGDLLDPEKFRTKYDQKTGEYSLEIMTVRGEDADTYKCFALNEFGKAVCTATLNVIEVGFKRHKAKEETDSALNSNPAEFRKMLRTRAGVEKCEKKEETIDAKFWELLLSADRKDYERLCAEYGVTDFRWMLKKLNEMKKKKEEEQAKYIDYISNLKHIEVKGDGTASFELDLVLKDPSSRIFLYKDGDMIPFSEDMEMKHQLKQVGKKLVFTIKDLLPEDAGVYQVDVEDVNVFSTEFKIPTVDFLVKIKEVKAKEREDALFECVLSHPLPMIIWIGKNSVLEAGEKYEISVSEDKLVHRLLVRDCMQLDRGIYTAVAGIRSSSAWLVVDADTDPRMNGKKKVRKTTQAGGSGVDLEAVAQEQLAKLLKEKEETKWLKEKEEAKLLKEKTEAKWLNGMEEAKWLNGKEEAKWLNGMEEAKWLKEKMEPKWLGGNVEAKWLNGTEEAKWLNGKEEAKWLNGMEEAKWLNGMEEAKWLNGKEEAKWLNGKEEAKWLNGMEEAKWLNRNEEAKWLKKMGEARLLKEKEEAKLLKENKEAKQLKGKEEAKLLKEKVEAKWLREKEEAILLKEKEGARLIKEKEEANWLKGKEEAKLMKEKEEAKLLKGMEETTWLKGLEETTLLKEKEEAKLMKEEVKLLKGMEEPKLLKDKAEEKLLEKKETTRPSNGCQSTAPTFISASKYGLKSEKSESTDGLGSSRLNDSGSEDPEFGGCGPEDSGLAGIQDDSQFVEKESGSSGRSSADHQTRHAMDTSRGQPNLGGTEPVAVVVDGEQTMGDIKERQSPPPSHTEPGQRDQDRTESSAEVNSWNREGEMDKCPPLPATVSDQSLPGRTESSGGDSELNESPRCTRSKWGPQLLETVTDPGVYFTRGLSNVNITKGQSADLICKLSSDASDGTWYKDGKQLSPTDTLTITKDCSSHKLTIHNCQEEHAGKYCFEADGRKTEALIIVEDPPRFNPDDLEKFSGPVIVKAGQNATFKIPFLGQDPARVQWYREGVELLENPNIKLEKMANQSRLLLRKCQRKDTGEIKVKIKNEFGTAEAISRLIVLDKPSPPQGPVEVLESSATCIEIKWRPPKDNGGSSVMSYTLERQQIGRNTWKKLGDVEPVPRYKDTDVDHGRKYCYHIWAVNREGVSDMMETEDVMAGTKAFPGLPAAPKIVSAFKDCINLSWTPPTKTGGSRIVGYNLEKRKKGSNLWTPVNPAKEPIQEKTYAVGDVVAGMEYEFRVAAINLSGVGEPSLPSESVFARDPKKCPGKVSDLKVTDSTFAILSLSWSKPAVEEGVQDEAKGYFVEIRPGDSLAWERCNANPASLTFFTVKGLRSMAMYWVRVIATNEGGEGQPQDLDNYILAMPPTVRPKITRNLKTFMAVKAGNSVRVNINFVASPMPDVIWLKDNVPVTKRVTISNSEGTSQLFIPTSERSDSGLYTIIIRNLVGQETFSVEIRVTDDPKPPGVVELEEKVPGTVTVSWEPSPDEKRDDRLHYMVSRRDSSKKTWSTIADRLFNNKFTACNIMPGCEYHFRVYAKNDMGVSEPSDSPTWGTARKREKFVVSMPVYKAHDLRRAPSFLVPLKTHTAPPGYECYMSCAVGGNPAPRITWLRNNVSLNADANYYISNTCGVCSLLILRVGPHDTGEYTVMAENRLGRAHCSTWLTITD
ncbi:immunoglobulin-like and fibronectin type III domain-containing protein 1 isoform X2 [Paramormyrops kingsleyae]|uniref:immunoglobulin-like and fibronectin type III domain-containing protein 1 isoform X2 n=1 Tax=Paramormyrops kingsleyae TaxID=1676925 RepID=UPI003B970FE2